MRKTDETALTLVYDNSQNLKFVVLLINYIYGMLRVKIELPFELMI